MPSLFGCRTHRLRQTILQLQSHTTSRRGAPRSGLWPPDCSMFAAARCDEGMSEEQVRRIRDRDAHDALDQKSDANPWRRVDRQQKRFGQAHDDEMPDVEAV